MAKEIIKIDITRLHSFDVYREAILGETHARGIQIDQEVLDLIKAHLFQEDNIHARAGNNLAEALILLGKERVGG